MNKYEEIRRKILELIEEYSYKPDIRVEHFLHRLYTLVMEFDELDHLVKDEIQ